MRSPRLLVAAAAIATAAVAIAADGSAKKRRPPPQEFGRVVIQNRSAKAGLAPVVFDHWLHRARYTCRLCHVDIGFAMKAGATDIRAADNASGNYCGACHNGKTEVRGKRLFEACTKAAPFGQRQPCIRCHSLGKDVKPEVEFADFAKALPRGRFGNGIDWEKAETDKLITLIDYLDGISMKRPPLAAQKDFALPSRLEGIPDTIFSHVKHTVWNGCELCHPDIFMHVRRGANRHTMADIFEGRSCGACHVSVAFPLLDCQRCHSKPMQ